MSYQQSQATVARTSQQAPHRRSIPMPRSLRDLYTQAQTDHAIRRERCRADRSGQPLSLVLFRVPRSIGPSRSALRVARLVLARARGTDEVGWFDAETICCLLPDTTADGASRFVDNVLAAVREPEHLPLANVYSYPSTWFLNGEDGPLQHGPQPHPASGAAGSHTAGGQAPSAHALSGQMPKAQSLERMLVRPMPLWKRGIDIAGASFGLLMFGPFMLAIAAAIRLTSPGPALFTQKRAGLGGRPFRIYKFRTMVVDAEARKAALRARSQQDGPAFKLDDDPRITRVGKLLRKTSLDELPQLWNVLKGDMSLVGPRPLPIDEQAGVEQWQRARLEVTPGLTCVWQVKGRSTVKFDEWVRMDVSYLRQRNFFNDIAILLATIPAVLLRRGAR